jgi:lipopolysaccharide transport system permease protein
MSSPVSSDVPVSLWAQRSLILQFTKRNIALRHRGSQLGPLWAVLNPLLMLALYVFVFGFIFNGSFGRPGETRVEYALGIFLGLSFIHFLSEIIGTSPSLIVSNPNFVKKVVFPLQIMPVAAVGAAFFHLLISLLLILAGIILFGPGLHVGMLWLPVVLLPLVLLSLGVAWLLSAFGVFLRDLNQVTQFVSMALLFASAVFYPKHLIPEASWQILRFNPMLLAIEMARDVMLWHEAVNFRHLAYLWLVGGLATLGGLTVFRRLKPGFADVM